MKETLNFDERFHVMKKGDIEMVAWSAKDIKSYIRELLESLRKDFYILMADEIGKAMIADKSTSQLTRISVNFHSQIDTILKNL